MGFACDNDAPDPDIERTKSSESRSPLPLLFEKTDSEKVTAMVPLLLASSKFDIMGLALSFRLAVLLD